MYAVSIVFEEFFGDQLIDGIVFGERDSQSVLRRLIGSRLQVNRGFRFQSQLQDLPNNA